VCWQFKTRFESGPANLTITVVHSYKLLINDVKPVHPLTRMKESSEFFMFSYVYIYQSITGDNSLICLGVFTYIFAVKGLFSHYLSFNVFVCLNL